MLLNRLHFIVAVFCTRNFYEHKINWFEIKSSYIKSSRILKLYVIILPLDSPFISITFKKIRIGLALIDCRFWCTIDTHLALKYRRGGTPNKHNQNVTSCNENVSGHEERWLKHLIIFRPKIVNLLKSIKIIQEVISFFSPF